MKVLIIIYILGVLATPFFYKKYLHERNRFVDLFSMLFLMTLWPLSVPALALSYSKFSKTFNDWLNK